jgi:hypothetical protein
MLRLPIAAVINVPPTRNTDEAIIIVFFRPSFSASGKANRAPKKQPACEFY